MSDRKLLTRRQILGVFGGATGLAIVGVEGQETSTNGNLLGGTSNMAQAYKVGEATYKGPLSVRSDVPQEDGITFIQTDAGSNNDMFAVQHYNGGWSEQGLDLPSVNTEQAFFGQNNTGFSDRVGERKLVSEEAKTINVGTDTDTIQEALNEIPLYLRHKLHITIDDGDYSGEDLLVPPVISADTAGVDIDNGSNEGASQNPFIQGNTSDPTQVKVNSITVAGTHGAIAPIITGMQVLGEAPYDDEAVAVYAYGCQDVSFRHLSFEGNTEASWGIMPYASSVTLRGAIDFGSDDLKRAVVPKHGSKVHIDDSYGGPLTGSVTQDVIVTRDGSVVVYGNIDTTPGGGNYALIDHQEGVTYDAENHEYEPAFGFSAFSNVTEQTASSGEDLQVQFDATRYDRRDYYDTSNYKYLIPKDGRYRIEAQVQWLSPATTTQLKIKAKELTRGDTFAESYGSATDGAANPTTLLSTTREFNASDEVAIFVDHDEGSDVSINTDYLDATYFEINRV